MWGGQEREGSFRIILFYFYAFVKMLNFYTLNVLSSVKMLLNKLIACKDKGLCIPLFVRERLLVTKIL